MCRYTISWKAPLPANGRTHGGWLAWRLGGPLDFVRENVKWTSVFVVYVVHRLHRRHLIKTSSHRVQQAIILRNRPSCLRNVKSNLKFHCAKRAKSLKWRQMPIKKWKGETKDDWNAAPPKWIECRHGFGFSVLIAILLSYYVCPIPCLHHF